VVCSRWQLQQPCTKCAPTTGAAASRCMLPGRISEASLPPFQVEERGLRRGGVAHRAGDRFERLGSDSSDNRRSPLLRGARERVRARSLAGLLLTRAVVLQTPMIVSLGEPGTPRLASQFVKGHIQAPMPVCKTLTTMLVEDKLAACAQAPCSTMQHLYLPCSLAQTRPV
jgi:hypothetical protein